MIKKKYRQNIYLALLILFIGSYPATFNLNALCIIFLAIFFLIDTKKKLREKFKQITKNKLVLIFSAYFFLQCIGLIHTENIKYGLSQISTLLPFLILPSIILTEKLNFKKKLFFFKIIKIWLVLFLFGLSIVQIFYFERSITRLNNFAYAYLGTSHIYISSLLYLLLLDSLRKAFKKREQIINMFYIAFFGFYILLFSSRTILIVLVLAIIYFFFVETPFKKENRKPRIFSIILLTFMLVVFISSSTRLKKKILTFYNTIDFNIETIITKNSITHTFNTIEHRVLIDYSALSIIKENPIIGVGTGDFQDELFKKYKKINFKVGLRHKLNTHNQYLQEYLKIGVIGFLFFFFLVLHLISISYKTMHELFYVAILVAIVCFFESYIARQHGVVFVVFFISFNYKQKKINTY